jgi:hypothetical protein
LTFSNSSTGTTNDSRRTTSTTAQAFDWTPESEKSMIVLPVRPILRKKLDMQQPAE